MNRGSEGTLRPVRPQDQGFNEAPIHESGKCNSAFQFLCTC